MILTRFLPQAYYRPIWAVCVNLNFKLKTLTLKLSKLHSWCNEYVKPKYKTRHNKQVIINIAFRITLAAAGRKTFFT